MNGERTIEIEVSYGAKDYWRLYLSHYLSFGYLFYSFLGFAVFGFLVTFLFLRKSVEFSHFVNIVLAAILFTPLFGLILSYFSAEGAKNLSSRKFKYIFSDEYIEVKSVFYSSRIEWTYYQMIRETGDYFILSTINGNKELIAKRYFQDSEQMNNFKNLIVARLGEKAFLKKSKEKLGLK